MTDYNTDNKTMTMTDMQEEYPGEFDWIRRLEGEMNGDDYGDDDGDFDWVRRLESDTASVNEDKDEDEDEDEKEKEPFIRGTVTSQQAEDVMYFEFHYQDEVDNEEIDEIEYLIDRFEDEL
jgi:hypothetical protein